MISDKRYFEQRAAEEAMRAQRAPSAEAREWHQQLANKFNRLAEEVEDLAGESLPPPLSITGERRAALG